MSLLGIGASLLGGLLGKKSEKKAINAQNVYNEPINVRARAEKAGFNPLLFIGPGVGQQTTTGGSNYLGSAIADAGLLAADAIARSKTKLGRVSELEAKNQRLVDQVTNLTIRPKVGGIYAGRYKTPSVKAALGVRDAQTGRSSIPAAVPSGALGTDLLTSDPAGDPRREVEIMPVPSDGGYMIIDNPKLGSPFRIPAVQGEMVDVTQLPVLGAAMAWNRYSDMAPKSRRILDKMGWTTPGTDYWTKWAHGLRASSRRQLRRGTSF